MRKIDLALRGKSSSDRSQFHCNERSREGCISLAEGAVAISPFGSFDYTTAWSIPPDLWKKHFESWADEAHQRAAEAALACFRPVAKAHVKERERALKQERQDQDEWLRKRAEEITGTGATTAIQPTLFDAQDPAGHRLPAWQTIDAPANRLASFATDGNQPPAKRSEADGVLRIYRQRMAVLDSLSALGDPEVIPLGVLVLVPDKR
jgi:hypothetical protein